MTKVEKTLKTQQFLETVVQENNCSAYELSAQMVQLEVVQDAIAKLMDRIDEMIHKGWNRDRGMAYLAINEIRDTVRLIDMGFLPLFKRMSKEAEKIEFYSNELFEAIIKFDSEQSNNVTTHEIESQRV